MSTQELASLVEDLILRFLMALQIKGDISHVLDNHVIPDF